MPTPENNKVKYGLKNCVWWPLVESTDPETGVVTTSYGEVHKLPGAVSCKFDKQGDRTVFRADDSDYFSLESNGGYSGTITVAEVPDDLREYAFNEFRDTNGVLIEGSAAEVKYFAFGFQFTGDKKGIRHQLVKCSLSKPSIGSETTPEGNTPNVQTDEMTLTAIPRPDDEKIHFKADPLTDTEIYAGFLTTVYTPDYTWELSITEGADTTVTVTRGGTELDDGDELATGDVLTITCSGGTLTVNGAAFVSGQTLTVSGDVRVVSTKSE